MVWLDAGMCKDSPTVREGFRPGYRQVKYQVGLFEVDPSLYYVVST